MKFNFIFMFVLLTSYAIAQAGKADSSFGKDGIVIGQNYNGNCHSVVIQKDGKIIAGGSGGYGNSGGFLLVRYNTDGAIDSSFGNAGRVITVFTGYGGGYAYSLALQKDGKIIMAGYASTVSLALVRYQQNGNLDSSFGNNGISLISLENNENVFPLFMSLQSDEKIVVTSQIQTNVNDIERSYMIRCMNDGSLDKSFGENGMLITVFPAPIEVGNIAIQPDGKIISAGTYNYLTQSQYFLARYLPDGNLDQAFGQSGIAKAGFGTGYLAQKLNSISLQTDGRIVCGGEAGHSYVTAMGLMRFTVDGEKDENLGNVGDFIIQLGDPNSDVTNVLVQRDGKIVATGNTYDYRGANRTFAMVRCNSNGSIDSSFGTDGVQITHLEGDPNCTSSALDKDGKIVLAGDTYIANPQGYYFALARYLVDKEQQPLWVRILRWIHHHVPLQWEATAIDRTLYYSVERSTNGREFKEIARIKPTGSRELVYEDAVPLQNKNYYRIKQVFKDGAVGYSNIVCAPAEEISTVKLYPNPVKDKLQVQRSNNAEPAKISILDFSGNVLDAAVINNGNYSKSIAQLKPGSYFLRVEEQQKVTTLQFVKE